MLRKKLCKMLAALMVSTIVLGSNVQAVGATERTNNIETGMAVEKKLQLGEYKVKNETQYVEAGNTTGESMARKALKEDTIINVEEDKITMTLQFNDELYPMMKDIKVSLDGVDLNGVNDTENKSITFEVPSIDAKVQVDMTVIMMGKAVSFFVTNDTSSIPTVDDSVEDNENQGSALANGIYKIANKALKVGSDSDSAIRNYIDTNSIVTVKDGRIIVTMKYNEYGLETVKSTNSITVEGKDVELTKNEDGSISFDIESIDLLYTRINVNLTYHNENLPEAIFPGKLHTVDVELLHEGELTEYKENDSSQDSGNNGETNKPGDENNGGNTGNEGSNNGGSNNNGSDNSDLNNGTTEEQGTKVYTGKNNVTHESETGLSMARKALEEELKVEEVNGKKYVTLTFTPMGSTMMSNHTIYVNGAKVEATKSVNGEIVSLKFAVGSLEDSIKVSAYVSMMGKNVEFGVDILEDTLTLATDGITNNGVTTGGVTGGTTSGSTTGSTTNGTSGNTTTTEETKVTKGKLYSIQNSVTHESETGRTMARKYLNSTSKVEEIDGKYYVTLTFTGSEFMQNHEIYVNGKKVTVSKTTSGDTTNIRFAVSSLSDSIKVKTYVVPMSREVEFGVELLKDTLTFIKEYTVDTLPQTGAPVGAGAVAGLGLILTSAGTVLAKKRK
ncbi:NEAT domain-containing protein [uncultured Clostridium sp.]|uniref:NEAT domain-containing protein n=1 Tax=uncultured Clostridium sp. TaxID=59620 RepID=UPI0025F4EE98|nr:NEAT domain-containing protein [uncultured Clostridium sp.]